MEHLIIQFGYLGLFLTIFAESGLLVGFFLPGDSLLITAGLLASKGVFNIAIILAGFFLAAVAGDSVGYAFGKKIGPKLFEKEDSLLFKKEYLVKAEQYFKENGSKAIILARFIPIIRTFTPVLAGTSRMPYKTFLIFNMVGGFIWSVGLTLVGYFLGNNVPNIDNYILPIIALILVVSVASSVKEIMHVSRKI